MSVSVSYLSLSFFKTIILNSLSGSRFPFLQGRLVEYYFVPLVVSLFPDSCEPSILALVSVRLKKRHPLQSSQPGFGRESPSAVGPARDSGWSGWWGPPAGQSLWWGLCSPQSPFPLGGTHGLRGSFLVLHPEGWYKQSETVLLTLFNASFLFGYLFLCFMQLLLTLTWIAEPLWRLFSFVFGC